MALQTHPETGIVYSDDPNNPHAPGVDRFVYIEAYDLATFDPDDSTTYKDLNANAYWGRNDGAPLAGSNPRFMYFKRSARQTVAADHRHTKISTPEMLLLDPAPPEGHPVGTYQVVEVAERLPAEDLKAQVETAFQTELRKRFPLTADPAILIEAGGALARKSDSATLSAEQTASVEALMSVEDAVRQLRELQAEMNAAIDADEPYDIEDWTISE